MNKEKSNESLSPFFEKMPEKIRDQNEIKTVVTICNRIDGEYTGIIEHLEVWCNKCLHEMLQCRCRTCHRKRSRMQRPTIPL
ncbi:MAG: hypothetical protein LBQ50_00190 [Planctomycetaceae bacterium]|jgi:hypothetical protein|nr:hypothetical protein [Planctomycetaceae bacterium]